MLIKLNSTGTDITDWQTFLITQKFLATGSSSGTFDDATDKATRDFQAKNNLPADGVVGNATISVAQSLGFNFNNKQYHEQDILDLASELKVAPAAIKAVMKVESGETGFKDGKLIILFEGHVFWKQLVSLKIDPKQYSQQNPDIVYQVWTKKYYQENQYDRLERARKINLAAANRSTSWGMFQIMGENYHDAGYRSAEEMIFITAQKLLPYLQNKDWAKFAKGYNGAGYAANQYDTNLAKAYNQAVSDGLAG
jgi:N-acetylmuramidase/Putative peptidoglycan binding domain